MESAAEFGDDKVHLADMLKSLSGVLRRRWLTLALVAGTILAVAIVLIMLIVPKYEAIARLQIDPSRNPLTEQSQVQTDLGSEAIETEVTVLNSDELARAVVDRLNLGRDPEFTKGLDNREGAPLSADERLNAVARQVSAKLDVHRDRLTYVIDVGFQSRDPDKAAAIANAFAKTYIDTRVGARVGTAERQSEFFKRQLNGLAKEVNAADAAVAQYRAKAGITEGGTSGTITDQQVAPLSTQLATAESDAAEARSNLAAARQQIGQGGLDSVSAVRTSPVIADLRRQRAEVLRNMGEITSRYGEKYSETIQVRDQLASLDTQIKEEAERAVNSLQASAEAAEARAASLRSAMKKLQGEQARDTRASVIATTLDHEAQTKRAAYDHLSQLSLDSTQGVRNQIAQASIIDRAVPPSAPTKPNRKMLLAMALVVALAAALATAIVQEMLVTGIRSIDAFEAQFGVPILAAIPSERKVARPADLVIDKPASLFAESIRMARASILGVRAVEKPPRIIAFTSAVPDEGKTTTALSLARVLAANGARTLLIDCDLRRAALRSLLSEAPSAGVAELLGGSATFEEAVIADKVNGLDIIAVREPHFSNDDLFAGDRMATLISSASYDQIVLDLPPLVGVAEARFVAALADAVVLIVKWGSTPRPAIESAIKFLRSDETRLVGAIFTMVDPSAEAIGGTYYSSKYQSYYQAA